MPFCTGCCRKVIGGGRSLCTLKSVPREPTVWGGGGEIKKLEQHLAMFSAMG